MGLNDRLSAQVPPAVPLGWSTSGQSFEPDPQGFVGNTTGPPRSPGAMPRCGYWSAGTGTYRAHASPRSGWGGSARRQTPSVTKSPAGGTSTPGTLTTPAEGSGAGSGMAKAPRSLPQGQYRSRSAAPSSACRLLVLTGSESTRPPGKASRNRCRRGITRRPEQVGHQMRVPVCRRRLRVSEQCADHWQALPARRGHACVRVAQVMNAKVGHLGSDAEATPTGRQG